jgi:hypothetical protein
MDFGGNITGTGQNWRKGYGASTDGGTTDVSQLTAWVLPFPIVLKYYEAESFRTSFTTDPTIEIYAKTGAAAETSRGSVTYDSFTAFPDAGSYQEGTLPDIALAAGDIVTVRQTAGQNMEFSTVTLYYEPA